MSIFDDDVIRLNFENFIWVVFIGLCLLDIVGDEYLKSFIKTNDKNDELVANKIFLFILVVSFFIYLYFLIRNIKAYENANEEEKRLFFVKVFGSVLFIVGALCLIYFQFKQTDFIGAPI